MTRGEPNVGKCIYERLLEPIKATNISKPMEQ